MFQLVEPHIPDFSFVPEDQKNDNMEVDTGVKDLGKDTKGKRKDGPSNKSAKKKSRNK